MKKIIFFSLLVMGIAYSGNLKANCDSCHVSANVSVLNNGSCYNLYIQNLSVADSCSTLLYSFVDYGNGMTDTIYPGQIIPDVYAPGNYNLCITAYAIKYDTSGGSTMCQSSFCTNVQKRNCCTTCNITADFRYYENARCDLIFTADYATDSCTSHLYSIIHYGNGVVDTVYPGDTIHDPYGIGNYNMCLTAFGQSYDSLGNPKQCIFKICKPVRKNACNVPGPKREKIKTEVSLYPNPSKGALKVHLNTTTRVIKVYSLSGTLVREIDTQGQELFEIDLSDLTKGIYFFEVEYENSIVTEKVVLY